MLSGYLTDGNGIESCIKIRNGVASAIFNKLGENISRMVLKSYILTGCGMTSKVGTKASPFAGFWRIRCNRHNFS